MSAESLRDDAASGGRDESDGDVYVLWVYPEHFEQAYN